MEAHIEVTAAGQRLRLSVDVQVALVQQALATIRRYVDGLLRPVDDWRVLGALSMLAEWATNPVWAMLDWPADEALWVDVIEPLLHELDGTPFEPQARITRQAIRWANRQLALPIDQRHPRFTDFYPLTLPLTDG